MRITETLNNIVYEPAEASHILFNRVAPQNIAAHVMNAHQEGTLVTSILPRALLVLQMAVSLAAAPVFLVLGIFEALCNALMGEDWSRSLKVAVTHSTCLPVQTVFYCLGNIFSSSQVAAGTLIHLH